MGSTAPISEKYDADVAIVGFGPSGVTAASYLGMAGIPTIALERDQDLYSRARAVTVNDWTLRIFQDFGIDERVKKDMDPARNMTWKTYENKLVFRLAPKPDVLGQPSAMMIYQPEMEAVIRENAMKYDSLDVRFGHSFVDIAQDDTGVTLNATDAEGKAYSIRVRYVIGADGGSSPVRQSSGKEMVGETRPRRWVVIDGEVQNFWPGCNDLVFWSDPVLPVVDIPLAKGNHRWEIPLGEGEKDSDYDSEEQLWARLNKLGITEHHVRIKGWAFYSHHVRHLEEWRSGRTVFIGDASHLMPPWAGQGMQSGIRDAQNVAWKYEFVSKGLIEDGILDTVQSERGPHVEAMTEIAIRLGQLIEADKPGFVKARNALGPILMHVPAVQNAMRYSSEQNRFENGWVSGKPTSKNSLGRMIPQPEVYDSRGRLMPLDNLLGQGFVILGLEQDPRSAMTEVQIKNWELLGARFLTVVDSSAKVGTSDIVVDHTGMLHNWMKRFKTSVIALRPDRFVAAANPTGLDVPAARGNLSPAANTGRHAVS
jgi:3-(3-hydroxy-phenyl)propionate hydroxylase